MTAYETNDLIVVLSNMPLALEEALADGWLLSKVHTLEPGVFELKFRREVSPEPMKDTARLEVRPEPYLFYTVEEINPGFIGRGKAVFKSAGRFAIAAILALLLLSGLLIVALLIILLMKLN